MTSLSDKPTVIIPAYNEANVILNLLNSISGGVDSGYYNIIVACNGCKDNTKKLVNKKFKDIICLDIKKASKTNAINEAESLGLGFPRIYIDADVIVSQQSLLNLINHVSNTKNPELCAPRAKINYNESDYFVKLFYSAWIKTGFFLEQGYGSGVYTLNKPARMLFDKFPDLISDDGFVRHLSNSQKISVCEDAISVVEAPRTLSDLIKIKTRIKLGNIELIDHINNQKPILSKKRFVIKPNILEFIVYVIINLYINCKVKLEFKKGTRPFWHRDESTRL